MTFEEVLAVLLSWVGRGVSVAIATAGDAPITGRCQASTEATPSSITRDRTHRTESSREQFLYDFELYFTAQSFG